MASTVPLNKNSWPAGYDYDKKGRFCKPLLPGQGMELRARLTSKEAEKFFKNKEIVQGAEIPFKTLSVCVSRPASPAPSSDDVAFLCKEEDEYDPEDFRRSTSPHSPSDSSMEISSPTSPVEKFYAFNPSMGEI